MKKKEEEVLIECYQPKEVIKLMISFPPYQLSSCLAKKIVGYWHGSIKSNLPSIGSFDLIEPCQYHSNCLFTSPHFLLTSFFFFFYLFIYFPFWGLIYYKFCCILITVLYLILHTCTYTHTSTYIQA